MLNKINSVEILMFDLFSLKAEAKSFFLQCEIKTDFMRYNRGVLHMLSILMNI